MPSDSAACKCVCVTPLVLEVAMQLIEPKPEETQEMANAFAGIKEIPWWRVWLEIAGGTAGVLTILEFLFRVFPG